MFVFHIKHWAKTDIESGFRSPEIHYGCQCLMDGRRPSSRDIQRWQAGLGALKSKNPENFGVFEVILAEKDGRSGGGNVEPLTLLWGTLEQAAKAIGFLLKSA